MAWSTAAYTHATQSRSWRDVRTFAQVRVWEIIARDAPCDRRQATGEARHGNDGIERAGMLKGQRAMGRRDAQGRSPTLNLQIFRCDL